VKVYNIISHLYIGTYKTSPCRLDSMCVGAEIWTGTCLLTKILLKQDNKLASVLTCFPFHGSKVDALPRKLNLWLINFSNILIAWDGPSNCMTLLLFSFSPLIYSFKDLNRVLHWFMLISLISNISKKSQCYLCIINICRFHCKYFWNLWCAKL